MKCLLQASLVLAAALPIAAWADPASDIAALRREIETIRAAHEAKLQAMEQRLQAAEAAARSAETTAASTTATAATAAAAAPVVTPAALPAPAIAAAPAGAGAFNPAMSLILSGLYQRSSLDPASYRLRGFALPADAGLGPGTRGFSLAESELGLAASIDPWWRGVANIALHGDNSVSVEEAYVQTTSLGQGLTLKAGRFLSGIGYLNSQHSHTWDFVDAPLAYQALLGTQFGDDGVQLQWLAPTDVYLSLGAELGRGRSYPGSDMAGNGAGATALTAHLGGDWGDSHSWRAGLSMLSAKAADQSLLGLGRDGQDLDLRFNGRSRVWVADAVWKWAPDGNATRTSFKLQGEYLRSTRTGELGLADAMSPASAWRAAASGWYVQGVYQFMPAWRVGLRTERVDGGLASDATGLAGLLAATGARASRQSLMLDFSPSEFSRLRLQLAQDRSSVQSAARGADRQITLQYQMSLGAHGAHSY